MARSTILAFPIFWLFLRQMSFDLKLAFWVTIFSMLRSLLSTAQSTESSNKSTAKAFMQSDMFSILNDFFVIEYKIQSFLENLFTISCN